MILVANGCRRSVAELCPVRWCKSGSSTGAGIPHWVGVETKCGAISAARPRSKRWRVHGARIFVADVGSRGSSWRPTVAESRSVEPAVLDVRSRAQQCRGKRFGSGDIRNAHARGFNRRAWLRTCSHIRRIAEIRTFPPCHKRRHVPAPRDCGGVGPGLTMAAAPILSRVQGRSGSVSLRTLKGRG